MPPEPLMTLAVACTVEDFQQFYQYWCDLGRRLDPRIHLLILVQLGNSKKPACPCSSATSHDVVFRQGLGLSRARNECIELCQTRWLWLMDADSNLSREFLKPTNLNKIFEVLDYYQAVVFHEKTSAITWQSAVRISIKGLSLKRLTSLRSPNLIFDADFATKKNIRFSPFLGKNSRLNWPQHGEEFAFAIGMALQGAKIEKFGYSPITALRPSTGESIGTLEKYSASIIIFAVIAMDWFRSKLKS